MMSCAAIILGAIAVSVVFPEKINKLIAMTQATPDFYQERADNWNYYRWELLDEYPIVFGGLTIFFVVCLIKNPKIGLFLSLSFLVPFMLHSLILPWKTYRYIFHILPLMYMVAGVGISACFSYLWSAGCKLNTEGYVPKMVWKTFVAVILGTAILGMLINMPWFMRTLKDYSNNFQLPHFADVQHHKWKNAMTYIAQHQREGDVIISGSSIHTRYYGANLPLYAMNDVRLRLNMDRNLKDEHGHLIDYASGAVVLKDLKDLKQVIQSNLSGWVMTYLWRGERFWNHPDRSLTLEGTFPDEVVHYLEKHLDREIVLGSPAIAVWRWSHNRDGKF